LRFLEFILGTPISEEEKKVSIKKTAEKFLVDPKAIIKEVNEIDAQMHQIYQITDIAQIGKMRSALISQLYAGSQNLTQDQQPFIIKLLYKYVPVLAIDTQNMLAFTFKDFEALIYLTQFNAQMIGQNLLYSQQQLLELQNYYIQQFNYLTLEQKQNLCTMQIQYEYISNIYNKMTPLQKQQWQNQILNQQAYQYQNYDSADAAFEQGYHQARQNISNEVKWPDGVSTKAEKQAYLQQMKSEMNSNATLFNIMQDVNINNDVMWRNIIEDWGDTGNYWEVKYDD